MRNMRAMRHEGAPWDLLARAIPRRSLRGRCRSERADQLAATHGPRDATSVEVVAERRRRGRSCSGSRPRRAPGATPRPRTDADPLLAAAGPPDAAEALEAATAATAALRAAWPRRDARRDRLARPAQPREQRATSRSSKRAEGRRRRAPPRSARLERALPRHRRPLTRSPTSLVFPSHTEGFGIPSLEAGSPPPADVCSDLPHPPRAAGDAAATPA